MLLPNNEERIRRDLLDAGCGDDIIDAFLEDVRAGNTAEGMQILKQYQHMLRDSLRQKQRHIDYLACLVYQMQKSV